MVGGKLMSEIYIIIFCAALISSIIVFWLNKLKKKIYKYIPSIILFGISLIAMTIAKYIAIGWDRLEYFMLFIISFISCTISFIVAIILDARRKKK